jgi:mRNA interferase HicA
VREIPRGISARQLIRALLADGFVMSRSRGSHRIYRHPDGRRVMVAYHIPSNTFPVGTLRSMIADTGWIESDLRRLDLIQ